MRRARIKAMATVPVRRKIGQSLPIIETNDATENADMDNATFINTPTLEEATQDIASDNLKRTDSCSVLKCEPGDDSVFYKNLTEKCEIKLPEAPEKVVERKSMEQGSPPKANRSCFMRPIPRFESDGWIRRNSVQGSGASASESEDDNRKTLSIPNNRLWEDQTPLFAQNDKENPNAIQNNVAKLKAVQKRRIMVSESARKLAEARREFFLKHENKTPDKSKLTMYDLIYYNPISNPMKKAKGILPQTKNSIPRYEESREEDEEEENVDDPVAMPTPRVKVGPDGQLILDEQSLVIERSDVKKHKQTFSKEAILDDDNNGGGFYKKRQKRKEWSKWETLKFYKALNTVGTDFLLMQSLFPNRTRQEIKLKYKKEEKINRKLIEKALEFHQEFDTDSLVKELAEPVKSSNKKNKKRIKLQRKKTKRLAAASIGEMDDIEDEDNVTGLRNPAFQIISMENEQPNNTIVRGNKVLEREAEEEGEEKREMELNADSESEQETYVARPTRSGRLPKIKKAKLQAPEVNQMDSNFLPYDVIVVRDLLLPSEYEELMERTSTNPEDYLAIIESVIPDIKSTTRESLIVLPDSTKHKLGEQGWLIFMVNPGKNPDEPDITPVQLSAELLATVTAKLMNDGSTSGGPE
ncbi:transcription factor TFIIIB component B'' homolog isoform X2 [Prorops nasuta]|uniref:transcription factor TFIIIB component B'' homolog isoform X2 n=1 Tax=Prorops nasuta TaxID=863751 RepID=UPI0034CE1778